MKKLNLILFFSLYATINFAQSYSHVRITMVKETQAVDSAIDVFNKNNYENDSCVYINLVKGKKFEFFHVKRIKSRIYLPMVNELNSPRFSYFFYKNNYIFLTGDILSTGLFKKTLKYQFFHFDFQNTKNIESFKIIMNEDYIYTNGRFEPSPTVLVPDN